MQPPEIITALRELFDAPPPRVSFEFFPPKTEEMKQTLHRTIRELEPLRPAFVSVTYGAGGSTRALTHETIRHIQESTALTPAAHLTCVAASREEIDAIARDYWEMGVRHLVALRGDAPGGAGSYTPHPDGYAYASDLVEGLKKIADFEISVAAYPETHPEAVSPESDLDHLKRKLDAGADRAITQYCFDTDRYLRFVEKARAAGITAPIIPGIVTINHFHQIVRFSERCGTSVPAWLHRMFEGTEQDPVLHEHMAVAAAAEQCRMLRLAGVEQFHFYTLNNARVTQTICHILGLRAE